MSLTNKYCEVFTPLRIDSGARAENIVIAGVTNTIDGAACLPSGTLANFINGAVDGDITDCMNNPEEYYLYHTINNLPNNIYLYSSMHIRPGNTFSVVNRSYKHINLKHILDYESTR
jgi:hypothetical protein